MGTVFQDRPSQHPDAFAVADAMLDFVEGPDVNDPVNDPQGGLTRWGISQRQNPDVDVAHLTRAQAGVLRRRRWWDPVCGDQLPWPLSVLVYDASYNMGPLEASQLLQQALRVRADGQLGPATMAAVRAADPWELAARFMAKRAVAYSTFRLFPRDGEGWMWRCFSMAMEVGYQSRRQP